MRTLFYRSKINVFRHLKNVSESIKTDPIFHFEQVGFIPLLIQAYLFYTSSSILAWLHVWEPNGHAACIVYVWH